MTIKQEAMKTEAGVRVWHQERAIFETTNMLCELMEKESISRSELAKRLKATKGYVTQLLDGSTNMTLRTIADAFLAIGYEFHPAFSRIDDDSAISTVVSRQQDHVSRQKKKKRPRVAVNNSAR
ncbi:MAG: hypothetical protein WEB58_01175 [Planctomycetaceae bacterium]